LLTTTLKKKVSSTTEIISLIVGSSLLSKALREHRFKHFALWLLDDKCVALAVSIETTQSVSRNSLQHSICSLEVLKGATRNIPVSQVHSRIVFVYLDSTTTFEKNSVDTPKSRVGHFHEEVSQATPAKKLFGLESEVKSLCRFCVDKPFPRKL
jgi:hypothetical protein